MVEYHPDGLLGGEIGVPAPGPEAGDVEAAVEVFAEVFRGDFGGFLVFFLGVLIFCTGEVSFVSAGGLEGTAYSIVAGRRRRRVILDRRGRGRRSGLRFGIRWL